MENTLLTNDVILVNKLIYGPKLLNSIFEISWINYLFNRNIDHTNVDKSYERAKGISIIKQGDIFVYKLKKNYFVVKRCVGTAGDLLEIRHGDIYTNNKKYQPLKTVNNIYKLFIDDRDAFNQYYDNLRAEKKLLDFNFDSHSLNAKLTTQEAERFIKDPNVKIEKVIDIFNQNKKFFAMPPNTHWTLDNMGPFRIPKEGMKIVLTSDNYSIYKKSIEEHENIKIEKIRKDFYVNNQKITTYTFKQNYYFVMGDNRKHSMDSRYIGFIPEKNIIGKTSWVLYSTNNNRFRWNRILHFIH